MAGEGWRAAAYWKLRVGMEGHLTSGRHCTMCQLCALSADTLLMWARTLTDACESVMTHRLPAHLHAQVVGGQGTVAVELLLQLRRERMDAVYVPVGGGGLIAGGSHTLITTGSVGVQTLLRCTMREEACWISPQWQHDRLKPGRTCLCVTDVGHGLGLTASPISFVKGRHWR